MFQYLNYVYKKPTQFDVDPDTRNYRYLELIYRQLSDLSRRVGSNLANDLAGGILSTQAKHYHFFLKFKSFCTALANQSYPKSVEA